MHEMKKLAALSNSSYGIIEKITIKNSTHNTEQTNVCENAMSNLEISGNFRSHCTRVFAFPSQSHEDDFSLKEMFPITCCLS